MNFIKTNDLSIENRHLRNCIEKTMPFVRARRSGKYYSVLLDLHPTIYDLNKLGKELVEKEIKNEIDAVESQRSKSRGIHHYTYDVISNCGQVLPERVDSFCTKLFEISTNSQNIREDKILRNLKDRLEKHEISAIDTLMSTKSP